MNNLGNGGKTVSSAWGVRNNVEVSFIVIVVDSINKERSIIFWWGRNDDLLCTSSQVLWGSFSGQEFSSGFQNSCNTVLSPWNFSRIKFRIESNFLSINNNSMLPELDMMRESTLGRIILEQIFEIFSVHHRIIDCSNIESPRVFKRWSKNESTNTAQSIDSKHF